MRDSCRGASNAAEEFAMGKHGNGDNLPPDGDRWPDEPVDLPALPALPEGVTIPDDLSGLGDEADWIRAEFEREQREPPAAPPAPAFEPDPAGLPEAGDRLHPRTPWFAGAGPSGRSEPSVGIPLMIMSVAVVITIVSMFAMLMTSPDSGSPAGRTVPEVVLTDTTGRATNVAALTPAVILFVESCQCERLIADTLQVVPPGVTVVVVGATSPPIVAEPPPGPGQLVLLDDPEGELRSALGLSAPPADAATVVVASPDEIIRITPATDTVESYADALASLTSR
jgi:hypothetical protein